MTEPNITAFIRTLVGKKLESFCCEADILDFGFSDDLVLHAMGCTRVVRGSDILLTTCDYQSWDGEVSTNNDEWWNMTQYRAEMIGGTVLTAEINPLHDLIITMDNGFTVQCLIANTGSPHYGEEQEQWALFEHTDNHSGAFLTVCNKEMDFSPRKEIR